MKTHYPPRAINFVKNIAKEPGLNFETICELVEQKAIINAREKMMPYSAYMAKLGILTTGDVRAILEQINEKM